MKVLGGVLDDLTAEQDDLDELVAALDEQSWDLPTTAAPWTIRDQIAHLAHVEEQAARAISHPGGFAVGTAAERFDGLGGVSGHEDRSRAMRPPETLGWWRAARQGATAALGGVDPEAVVPWYGAPVRARHAAATLLMETWVHGDEVADALGMPRTPTDRLFHVAHLGVAALRFSFESRGATPPERLVRVALRGPSGRVHVWNDEADDSVTGPLTEFCLVVARRRPLADTHLVAEGDVARRWMEVAQVFAGPLRGRPGGPGEDV